MKTQFLDELGDMYDAENRLTRGFSNMAKAATHEELRETLLSHREETEKQVKKLERVFEAF